MVFNIPFFYRKENVYITKCKINYTRCWPYIPHLHGTTGDSHYENTKNTGREHRSHSSCLVILGFGISPASASAVSWTSGTSTAVHGHGTGHHFAFNSTQRSAMTESFITQLQNQGVDVS